MNKKIIRNENYQEVKFKPGDIVKHKLTKEKMLVLPMGGFGFSSAPESLRVRKSNYEIIWVGEYEVFKTK